MKRHWLLAVLLVLTVALPRPSAAEKIVIAGTGDSQELLRVLAADYEKRHPGVTIEVPESVGSGGGAKALVKGSCNLARIARPLSDKERALGLSSRIFAVSPVVVVVNPDTSKVQNLSSAQLVGIYSGTITDWSQLGGKPGKIFVANREGDDTSRAVLAQQVPGFAAITQPVGKILFSTPELIEVLSRYTNTIGFAPLATARQANLRVLQLDGVSPTQQNVHSGKYPYALPLALVWRGQLNGLAKAFVDYLGSAEAQSTMIRLGAYPTVKGGN